MGDYLLPYTGQNIAESLDSLITVRKNQGEADETWSINVSGNARSIIGDNLAADPAHALLHSGAGRPDSSPNGDTWLYYDDASQPSAPWGIRHNQAANTIGFIGGGVEKTSINLQNGFVNTNGAYGQQKWAAFNSSGTTAYEKSISLTTHGRPVFLCLCGDNNPLTSSAWHNIYIYRGSTTLAHQICESHGASWNIPFCLCYLDIVSAGTYNYRGVLQPGSGTIQWGESGNAQAPQFIAFEI